jgi:hypothetical protein
MPLDNSIVELHQFLAGFFFDDGEGDAFIIQTGIVSANECFERTLIARGQWDGFEGPAGGAAFDGVKDGHGIPFLLNKIINLEKFSRQYSYDAIRTNQNFLTMSLLYREGQFPRLFVTFCEVKGTTPVSRVGEIPEAIVSILPSKGRQPHEEKLQRAQERMV